MNTSNISTNVSAPSKTMMFNVVASLTRSHVSLVPIVPFPWTCVVFQFSTYKLSVDYSCVASWACGYYGWDNVSSNVCVATRFPVFQCSTLSHNQHISTRRSFSFSRPTKDMEQGFDPLLPRTFHLDGGLGSTLGCEAKFRHFFMLSHTKVQLVTAPSQPYHGRWEYSWTSPASPTEGAA